MPEVRPRSTREVAPRRAATAFRSEPCYRRASKGCHDRRTAVCRMDLSNPTDAAGASTETLGELLAALSAMPARLDAVVLRHDCEHVGELAALLQELLGAAGASG